MKISFTKKAMITLVISVFVTMFLISWLYIYMVTPKFSERSQAESALETEKQILEVLQENVLQQEEETLEQTTELQRKLPVEPLLDQLLLDFQRVEALSNTYIQSIDFDQNSDVSIKDEEAVEQAETEEIESNEGLKQITAFLTVQAKEYENLYQFLAEIDRLPRIIGIDSVSFIGPNENIMIDEEIDVLEFLVTVSTYYYPELMQLKDELPKVMHPEPSERENPLYDR